MVYDRSRHQSEDLGRVWVSLIAESGPLFTDLLTSHLSHTVVLDVFVMNACFQKLARKL